MSESPDTPPTPEAPNVGQLPVLSLAVEGGVVLIGARGGIDFVSPSTTELHEGHEFEDWWSYIQGQIEGNLDRNRLYSDGEVTIEVALPESLGGRPLFVRLFPIDEEDCAGYLAVLKDQSGLDKLQADLRLANQMRRLGVTLRQATHDLKAPLQAMTLNLDLLRREISEELGDDGPAERCNTLEREVRRLGRMLQIVLNQSPSTTETPRSFDLRRLVRELVTLIRPQARAVEVELSVSTPPNKLTVLAVRDHLKQALLNLMINGLEAMNDGGQLDITLSEQDGNAQLLIRDDGEGIPEAVRAQLFRLHFTTKSTGSGIGLFTARATIQKLGGTLALESDGESGTTACVTLPLDAFQAEEQLPCSTS